MWVDWWGLGRRLDCCSMSVCRPSTSSFILVSDVQLSSPSKTPGMPTRSRGIPSSASASIFSGCSRARREAKPGVVYCPLARPVFGMSRSLGGFGGGGRALEYLILAMKSWRACEDCEEDILAIGVGTNDRCLEGKKPRRSSRWSCGVCEVGSCNALLERVASAKIGSFGGLSEVGFLVARHLKNTRM